MRVPDGVGWTAVLTAIARAAESRRPDRLFADPFAEALAALPLRQIMAMLPDPDADVHEQVIADLEAARLRRAVRALPTLELVVIIALYGLSGPTLSRRQASARLGLSRRNLAAIEQRALGRLRSALVLPKAA